LEVLVAGSTDIKKAVPLGKRAPRTMDLRPAFNVVMGRRLWFLREIVNKKSIHDLSIILGVTASAIRQWESGHTRADPNNMAIIADYFDVSLDYLWCREFTSLSEAKLRSLPDRDVHRRPMASHWVKHVERTSV
jgi:transcriptional regulator with XRE-family HTH domain